MRKMFLLSAAMLGLAAAPAFAQNATQNANGARPGNIPGTNNSLPLGTTASNIVSSDTRSDIAPHLPTPRVGDDGTVVQYLRDAQTSLNARRTGEAQQALEMAETRALDRSTPVSAASTPDQNPVVKQISQALESLGRRDMAATNNAISQAMTLAGTQQEATGTTKM
jgi:hypothetical protein